MSNTDTPKTAGKKLLGNLMGGERRRHQVAMITEEGEWNQHEANSGMARVFVVMLLIHVVLIGGIIIYDFVGTDTFQASPAPVAHEPTADPHELSSNPSPSALPQSSAVPEASDSIPSAGTYIVQSGDSLPAIAARNGVALEELIALNGLDAEGATLSPDSELKLPAHKVDEPKRMAVVKQFPSESSSPAEAPAEVVDVTPMAETPPAEAPKVVSLLDQPAAAEVDEAAVAEAPPTPAPAPMPAAAPEPTPAPAVAETPAPAPEPAPAPAPATTAKKTHKVAKGDTLYGLSRKYGVSVSAIQKANSMADTTIRLDDVLVIPAQ